LVTEDGQNYPLAGTMEFSEVTVDTSTGSLVMRALFPNPEQRLLPGMFVRARVSAGMDPAAILVPQLAVSRNDRGEASVLLVNQAGQTEPRPLVAERSVGTSWLVTQGLNPGDRVIVEGLQMLRPGMPVTPIPARPLTASAQ
jgi:RND family efflux transporter MFP subunit